VVHKPKINNEIRFMARPGSSEAMAFFPSGTIGKIITALELDTTDATVHFAPNLPSWQFFLKLL
jgi:hypothetical protein